MVNWLYNDRVVKLFGVNFCAIFANILGCRIARNNGQISISINAGTIGGVSYQALN